MATVGASTLLSVEETLRGSARRRVGKTEGMPVLGYEVCMRHLNVELQAGEPALSEVAWLRWISTQKVCSLRQAGVQQAVRNASAV